VVGSLTANKNFAKKKLKKKMSPPLLFLGFKVVAVGVCGRPQTASLRLRLRSLLQLRSGISTAIRGTGFISKLAEIENK